MLLWTLGEKEFSRPGRSMGLKMVWREHKVFIYEKILNSTEFLAFRQQWFPCSRKLLAKFELVGDWESWQRRKYWEKSYSQFYFGEQEGQWRKQSDGTLKGMIVVYEVFQRFEEKPNHLHFDILWTSQENLSSWYFNNLRSTRPSLDNDVISWWMSTILFPSKITELVSLKGIDIIAPQPLLKIPVK